MMVKPDLVLALLSLVVGDLGRILPENQLQIGNRLREHCTFFRNGTADLSEFVLKFV